MEKKTPFFSIIVPVYNVQDYLKACVSSVLNQSFGDFQLILVDDGSTDESGRLCDELAQSDARVFVIHQENQGQSVARNRGLKEATGTYILFLDSDDFYPQLDFLENLANASHDQDVVCFNYARYTDHLLKNLIAFPTPVEPVDQLWLELVRSDAFTSSPCLKAVKRELLVEQNILFEEGVLSEDIEWNAKVMRQANSLALAPDCVYAYRVRPGSVTHSIHAEHVRMQLGIVRRLSEETVAGSEAFCSAYRSYVAFQYCTVLINLRLSRPKIDGKTKQEIKNLAWLLQYDENRIVRLIHRVYKCLGFEITSWLLVIYFKLFCK